MVDGYLKLDSQMCFRLYTAARQTMQAYEPLLKQLGITYTQYLVLLVLWESDKLPINDIGKKLLLGINTMSPLIKRMEGMGLIVRQDNPADKRQQLVVLTPKAKKMQQDAHNIPVCLSKHLIGCGIDEDKMLSLMPLLDEFIRKMERGNNDDEVA